MRRLVDEDNVEFLTLILLPAARIVSKGIVGLLALTATVFLVRGDQALAGCFAFLALATAWIPLLLQSPLPTS
jgi:hypothetical protein